MIVSPHGTREIALSAVLLAPVGVGLAMVHLSLIAIPALTFLGVLYFFRDPPRRVPAEQNVAVSPADGTITDVEKLTEDRFLRCPCVRVGIFLSITDVHVNRSPLAGVVRETRYQTGKFYPAFYEKASAENEANDLWIHNDTLPLDFVVRQISGAVARRIVCAAKPGQTLEKGERIGMIKFGSRTELYLPEKWVAEVVVRRGDRVRGGVTAVARLRSPEDRSS